MNEKLWTYVTLPGRVDIKENGVTVRETNSVSLAQSICNRLNENPFSGETTGSLAVDKILHLSRKGKISLS